VSHAPPEPPRTPERWAIATHNEGPLHAALKDWYAEPGDRLEVPVAGRQIDLVRGELLIEIQTGSFRALRSKLRELVGHHPIRLVYPIPVAKWIVRQSPGGKVLGRRKSPLRGRVEHAFSELVSLPRLFLEENFSFEILLVQAEEVRRFEAGRARRRKGWVIVERRLLSVVSSRRVEGPDGLLEFLPANLPRPFTTSDLASGLGIRRDLAQKMAYCLREARAIEALGRGRSGIRYRATQARSSGPNS